MIFLLKILLAVVGVVVIALALFCFFTKITEELGFFAGLVGAGLVFFVFKNDAVTEFFGVSFDLIMQIALGAMVGGGIISAIEFERLGSVMITVGWIAVGLILMQVVPIPVISNLMGMVSLPFLIACIPLLLLMLFLV